MCLLVVAWHVDARAPLVVAANRDERLDRPAAAAVVLQERAPRIVGGRDQEAGGTWLAVNDHGVVAGLTNRPGQQGRDPSKRSRGELPLALAAHTDAESAVEQFAQRFRPCDYNPSWLLVGDRRSLFYLDMTDGDHAQVRALPPGIHILENNPIDAGTAKQRRVAGLLGTMGSLQEKDATAPDQSGLDVARLAAVLGDHSPPDDLTDLPEGVDPAVLAACVHTDRYGTRSAAIVRVLDDADALPEILVADGHPCTAPFKDVGVLWRS